ncbi:MAG: ACP S-malonyltransferase [Calditrichaeota bacterium]|nr:ACP S-malonyltransferase [Calditrichota bacterium]
MKQRAVVICPGRGSYNAEELGYLKKYRNSFDRYLDEIDHERRTLGEITVSEMDNMESYDRKIHTKGEHASALIYACALADFHAINREKYEIVAICGNSMGWYLTLAFAGALDRINAFRLVNTMGSMMKDEIIGGQVIYPVMNDEWQFDQERYDYLLQTIDRLNQIEENEIYISIHLGSTIVLGANKSGIRSLLKELEPVKIGKVDYPFQLMNHAAFHTALLNVTSERAFAELGPEMFQRFTIPIIDGRGYIWQPYSSDLDNLRDYTLGHQVVQPYDFTTSVRVAIKEFAPDKLILLGPGQSLGGAVGQTLIQNQWLNIRSKTDFTKLQKTDPFVLAMGREDQRKLVSE